MTRTVFIVALAALAFACNSKSPEQTGDGNEVNPGDSPTDPIAEPKEEPKLAMIAEPTHVAFDVLSNRPLGHRLIKTAAGEALFFHAGAIDFVKYIAGNHAGEWKLDSTIDGVQSAAMRKTRKAKIWVPALGDAKTLTMRVFNPDKQNNPLTVKLNGKDLETQDVAPGWQTVVFDTAGHAKLENELALTFKGMGRINKGLSGGAIEWLSLGAPVETAPTDVGLTTAQGQFDLTPDVGLVWHQWALKAGELVVTFDGAKCAVRLRGWKEEGDSAIVAFDETRKRLTPNGAESTSFSLPDDQVVRLALTASECDKLEVKTLAMVVPGDKPAVPKITPPKHILFWMIDTLRADYLPIHFDTDVKAPNLKKLAAEGTSFRVAYVQGNESRTSHAALFSGMYPEKTGIVGRGKLKPNLKIMPEALKELKYRTGGYVSNGYVSKPFGYVQGWDMYLNNLRANHRINGKPMAEMAAKWIAKQGDKNTFMYVGTIDPHVTYRAHKHLIGQYDDVSYTGRFRRWCSGEDLGRIKGKKLKVSDRDKKRIEALYKNEITYNDEAFGIIRAELEAQGKWEDTLVVISSDHGEEFWEHGSVGHGDNAHQELVHVPMIFHYPKGVPKGRVISSGADSIDIYPTLVDLAGGKRADGIQGKSLVNDMYLTDADYPDPAISTSYKIHYAMQLMDWKMLMKRGQMRVYDRTTDPLEKENVAEKHPLATRWLNDSLGWYRTYRSEWDKKEWGTPSDLSAGFLKRSQGK